MDYLASTLLQAPRGGALSMRCGSVEGPTVSTGVRVDKDTGLSVTNPWLMKQRATPMADIADVTAATRESIGRYFSLVSFIPSALLVAYLFVLLSSGALRGPPDPVSVAHAVSHLSLADVAALTLLSVGAGLALHPLQFAFVQLFEGYWGTGAIAQQARSTRIWWHWRRVQALRLRAGYEINRLQELPADEGLRKRISIVSRRDEANRLSAEQPRLLDQMMPTRLGNVLRYYESMAGAPYKLDAIGVMPYLARVAPAEDMDYVNDQRSNLDLAVRLSLVSMIAFVISLALLWRYGLWLLVALVPYTLAFLSYRGAVVAASAYGRAFATLIALNRFALYERLHLAPPRDSSEERYNNVTLGYVLNYSDTQSVRYQHPEL